MTSPKRATRWPPNQRQRGKGFSKKNFWIYWWLLWTYHLIVFGFYIIARHQYQGIGLSRSALVRAIFNWESKGNCVCIGFSCIASALWLARKLVPLFQPIKSKTNHDLHAAISRPFTAVTCNCPEFWLACIGFGDHCGHHYQRTLSNKSACFYQLKTTTIFLSDFLSLNYIKDDDLSWP